VLSEVWGEVLQIERIGIHDNFFELGGHSLLATQVMSRLNDRFEIKLPLHVFFETPTIAGEALDPKSNFNNFRMYTSSNVILNLEEIARKSDDKVGFDLGKYAGATIFKGIPFKWINDLDTELTYVRGADPIYGVNHSHFYPIVLADNNFRRTAPAPIKGSHNVLEAFIDLTYAYVCDNRRTAGFLISDWEGGN